MSTGGTSKTERLTAELCRRMLHDEQRQAVPFRVTSADILRVFTQLCLCAVDALAHTSKSESRLGRSPEAFRGLTNKT